MSQVKTQTYNTVSSGTWTAPNNSTDVVAYLDSSETWGTGGTGGNGLISTGYAGGGAGGGGYNKQTGISVTPGNGYAYVIPASSTSTSSASATTFNGTGAGGGRAGGAGTSGVYGTGGTAGTGTYSGGAGAAGFSSQGGGGGSSGGTGANGAPGSAPTGGTAPAGGGNGGNGGTASVQDTVGSAPGGGGGGGRWTSSQPTWNNGQAGGAGKIVLTWTDYYVTYNANGATGGAVPSDTTGYTKNATVTTKTNSGSLVRTGCTFTGWNTAANGSGTHYNVSATFTQGTSDDTLYAEWKANVTYNGNGNTGGTAPTDSSSPYLVGATVTILGNTGSLTKTSYKWDHWNTASDNSGITYYGGNTFTISQNVTLYAIYVPTYTVTYNGNGNSGGTAPVDSNAYTSGQQATLLGPGSLTKTNFDIDSTGWYQTTDGSGTRYIVGNTYTVTANTTFYAGWECHVLYHANGGTGICYDPNQPYWPGTLVTIISNAFTPPSGKIFDHWNTAVDNSGTSYSPTNTFTISQNVDLYAQWKIKITNFIYTKFF